MDSLTLQTIKCPHCHNTMTHGYIAGHWVRLRWTEKEKTQPIFSGHPLRKKITWFSAPTIESMRCETCKIGVFRYDY